MYRSNVDSGYKNLIEKQVANGLFDDYIVALMHWLLQEGINTILSTQRDI